mgnify:CR=1 FL=1
MKQYQSKHTAALSTRGFYTILSLCALIIAASAWVIWGNAHRQNAVEPDTGMPIIAPADSTAEAPTEPATVPQQEQEPESVIEEQPVAEGVVRLLRIVAQELGIEQCDEIGSAHSSARVARLGLFDHGGRQNTDVVGSPLKFGIYRHIGFDRF